MLRGLHSTVAAAPRMLPPRGAGGVVQRLVRGHAHRIRVFASPLAATAPTTTWPGAPLMETEAPWLTPAAAAPGANGASLIDAVKVMAEAATSTAPERLAWSVAVPTGDPPDYQRPAELADAPALIRTDGGRRRM